MTDDEQYGGYNNDVSDEYDVYVLHDVCAINDVDGTYNVHDVYGDDVKHGVYDDGVMIALVSNHRSLLLLLHQHKRTHTIRSRSKQIVQCNHTHSRELVCQTNYPSGVGK